MTIRFKRSLTIMVFVGWASAAGASLIDNGSSMFDTDTGLEWLDITETAGLSYNAVLSSAFIVSDGYRFASEAEVFELYENAGGTPTQPATRLPENKAPAILLLDLMGCTGSSCDGIPEDFSPAMWGASSAFIGLIDDITETEGILSTRWITHGDDDTSRRADVGAFLVRANAPPPSTPVPMLDTLSLALLALLLGLVGFKVVRRV